jgi:short-subunit dehydrogenase
VPWLGTYAATKAFLLSWTHALDTELQGTGVRVCVCCPGTTSTNFVKVAGADARANAFPEQPAADVARDCLRGLDRGQRVIVPGLLNRAHRVAAGIMPSSISASIAASVNRPKSTPRRPSRTAE